jgi:hypothetical protein
VAGLYLVGAWLIIQMTSTMLPAFEAPGWVLRAVMITPAVGLILALTLSWASELTPQDSSAMKNYCLTNRSYREPVALSVAYAVVTCLVVRRDCLISFAET